MREDVGSMGWARARTVCHEAVMRRRILEGRRQVALGAAFAMIRAREEHSQLHIGIGWCLVRVRRA